MIAAGEGIQPAREICRIELQQPYELGWNELRFGIVRLQVPLAEDFLVDVSNDIVPPRGFSIAPIGSNYCAVFRR